jgi:hypothetical protein
MKKATATMGKPAVWRVKNRNDMFKVESQSKTLVNYLVQEVIPGAEYRCWGNSERERCWPFYQKGMCKHIRSVIDFLAELEAPTEPKPASKLRLEDLFE